jgi:predicted RNase H-like HicB family nuclease
MNTKTAVKHEEIIIAAGREYPCQFRKQRDGGYLVTCPKFLPLAAYGDTLELARAEARQRIEAWIEYADCREFV